MWSIKFSLLSRIAFVYKCTARRLRIFLGQEETVFHHITFEAKLHAERAVLGGHLASALQMFCLIIADHSCDLALLDRKVLLEQETEILRSENCQPE